MTSDARQTQLTSQQTFIARGWHHSATEAILMIKIFFPLPLSGLACGCSFLASELDVGRESCKFIAKQLPSLKTSGYSCACVDGGDSGAFRKDTSRGRGMRK